MKEPTWKEALGIARKQTKDKLAPMLRAMIEAVKEKENDRENRDR